MGIEAISRGAAHVTFVEMDRRACALIARNLATCQIQSGYAIISASVLQGVERLASEPRFDVILLDPPYASDIQSDIQNVLQRVGEIVKLDGLVVLEHARKSPPPVAPGRLTRVRELKSGDSALTLYTCQP